MTGRRDWDGPSLRSSWGPGLYFHQGHCDGPSHLWRSVLQVRYEVQRVDFQYPISKFLSILKRDICDGPSWSNVSKHIENLKLGTENQLSELCDGMAGRTVTGVTDRHRPLVEIWVSELCDDLQDGPSQARRPVTGCANPRQSRISGEILRDIFGLFFP